MSRAPGHAEPASRPKADWKCAFCKVEIRWAGPHRDRGLPANWSKEHGGPACLACRRDLAAEAAVEQQTELSFKERARLRSFALLEFEVRRDPDRSNAEIAGAVHTSVVAVQKARDRIGASSFHA